MRWRIKWRMSIISDTIKRLRAEPFGLSQTEIANRIDTSQSRISRWEDGDIPAGANTALKLIALEKELSAVTTHHPAEQAAA